MTKPRLLVLSLGGTITMVPSEAGGSVSAHASEYRLC